MRWWAFLAVVSLTVGLACAAPSALTLGAYKIRIDVSPPQVGDATVDATVEEAGGPAPGVEIQVTASMPDMPAMAPVTARVKSGADGRATTRLALSMAGQWRIRVQAGGAEQAFPLEVAQTAAASQPAAPRTGDQATVTFRTVAPPQVGENVLRLDVRSPDGKPLDAVDVWVGLVMPGMFMHVPPRKAQRIGPGQYESRAALLMAGRWDLTVDVDAATGRAPDDNGRVGATRLARTTWPLTVAPPSSLSTYLPGLLAGLLVTGFVVLVGARRAPRSTLLGCFVLLVATLGAGRLLHAHWPRDASMGMEMDMAAPDMGIPAAAVGAPVPVVVERVRRGTATETLSLDAVVMPFEVAARPSSTEAPASLPSGWIVTGDRSIGLVDRVRVQARVTLRDRKRLALHLPAEVVDDGEPIAARLDEVGDVVDVDTQTLGIQSWVANPGLRLRPGQRVSLRVQLARKEDVLLAPLRAVAPHLGHPSVWLLESRAGQFVARQKFVQPGIASESDVELLGGVQAGDPLLVDAISSLEDGTCVVPASPGGGPYRNLLLP